MKLYYDGQLSNEAKVEVETILPMFHTGAFVLGQENDNVLYGGSFDAHQAFSGKLSQVEVWNKEISPDVIKNMSTCRIKTIDDASKIISWDKEKWGQSKVPFENVMFETFCMYIKVPLNI